MYIPEKPAPMPAGHYPSHVVAACVVCEVDPAKLLDWSVKPGAVTLILPEGQKVVFLIDGPWLQQMMRVWEEKEIDIYPPEREPLIFPEAQGQDNREVAKARRKK